MSVLFVREAGRHASYSRTARQAGHQDRRCCSRKRAEGRAVLRTSKSLRLRSRGRADFYILSSRRSRAFGHNRTSAMGRKRTLDLLHPPLSRPLLAQLDRAPGFEPGGWGFKSLGAGHLSKVSEWVESGRWPSRDLVPQVRRGTESFDPISRRLRPPCAATREALFGEVAYSAID